MGRAPDLVSDPIRFRFSITRERAKRGTLGRNCRVGLQGVKMEIHREGDYQVLKIGPLGPYNNNAYIISDTGARQSLIVDMPAESQQVVDAIGDLRIGGIIATHWHPDHWADYDLVRGATGAPVYVHEAEIRVPPERIDGRLRDGQEIQVGGVRVRVIHTPGHTPGSISLRVGRVLISGDTLFDGGPGRTAAP